MVWSNISIFSITNPKVLQLIKCVLFIQLRKRDFLSGPKDAHFSVGNSLVFPAQSLYAQLLMATHLFRNKPHVFEDDYPATPQPSLLRVVSILCHLIRLYRSHFPTFKSSPWGPLLSKTSPNFLSPSPVIEVTTTYPKAQ